MKQHILILGVTASGKGRLAFELAKELDAEIISIDSMKIYRRMDIGTAKPPLKARKTIKYHLIDIVEPSDSFSVGTFLDLATEAAGGLERIKKPVIASGGTALYIKALLYGLFDGPGADENIRNQLRQQAEVEGLEELYFQLKSVDPKSAQRISCTDARRVIRALEVYRLTGKPISSFQTQFDAENPCRKWTIIGLRSEKGVASARINRRVKKMIDSGLVDEVRSLLSEDKPLSKQASGAIGYAEIIDYLNGKTTLEKSVELIKQNTRRLAKHQRTWFKTFKDVHWLDIAVDEPMEAIAKRAKIFLIGD